MKITIKPENARVIIDHDGLMVAENTLEEAVISYGEGMFMRGMDKQAKHANNFKPQTIVDCLDAAYVAGLDDGKIVGRRQGIEEVIGLVNEYFKGLIAIPDPQATRSKMIKYLNSQLLK